MKLLVVMAVVGFCRVSVVLWMHSMSFPLDYSVETVLLVRGVVDDPLGAIGFMKGVVALHDISIPGLFLFLDVVGMRIMYAVFELVLRVSLKFDIRKKKVIRLAKKELTRI